MEETPMYTTLEKTLFLKGVTLFKDIPGEEVAHIAQIADTINLESNEVVFEDGDPGDSMFIIVDGEVRIHKEGKEIATLGDSEFIGEMAILDQEPRSASATTQEETVLLRISGRFLRSDGIPDGYRAGNYESSDKETAGSDSVGRPLVCRC
ncbi:MAG TPA: cyclic nucleotide-binding domain-containing protein [Candidatus Marinimicrobia bacterium]|nr:cyclic nucleotide-binding domain-containing protein [Candidatus Neomarinimicrobiota bacterium]